MRSLRGTQGLADREEGLLTLTLTHQHTPGSQGQLSPPRTPEQKPSLTLFTVVLILMEPVAIPAPAQVAPKRVDTLVLAPAVVLSTLVLVWGDQRTLLRGTTNLGWSLSSQNPAEK